MTEQEIKDRLAELYAKQKAATSWGAAVGARHEEIKSLEGQLAASRRPTQSPSDMADDAPFVQGQSERGDVARPSLSNARPVSDFATGRIPEFLEPHPTLGGGNGEAVRWLILYCGEEFVAKHKRAADFYANLDCKVTPLYAAPQPRDDADDGSVA